MIIGKNYIYIIVLICVILSVLYYYYKVNIPKNKQIIATITKITTPPKVVLYYTDWCGACKSFKPIWEKIEENKKNSVTLLKIDADKYQKIAEDNGITEFPTIHKHIDDIKIKYEGNFTYDDVMKFIN